MLWFNLSQQQRDTWPLDHFTPAPRHGIGGESEQNGETCGLG